jgi:arsenite/tail-anchored protein-transporting ATPase
LLPYNVLGLEKLRSFLQPALQERIAVQEVKRPMSTLPEVKGLDALVDELTGHQEYGLILTMGKGGTGKTITAATLALLIAKRGHRVHLTTTDPAAHIQDYLQQMDALPDTLSVDRIDPKLETQRYVEKVFTKKGTHLDEQGKKLLLEDLKSPCTEEVAVFHAFSRAIQQARRQFVVVDTAPTGHTLLLLDTAGNYHRDVLRNSGLNKEKIRTPYMYLQDRQLSTVLMISLPETTPMREAAALQEDLHRAGIAPAAWVVNRCLALQPELQDPLLRARAGAEIAVLEEIATQHTAALYAVPFVADKNVLPILLARYCHGGAERPA